LLAVLAGARAQGPAPAAVTGPSVDQLRADLEQLRASGAAAHVPEGALLTVAYTIDVAERIAGKFSVQSQEWRARAARYLALAKKGEDPALAQRGKLIMRGYRSPVSELLQGYGIYVPADYDPQKKYPLLIMLHGGSANGNLFLGVVLGNNMNWKEYNIHLWDEYEPRWAPEWIVVAPDGFGQIMWRWMGERDVLDVVADVQKHYNVDADRIVLGGLSNGGVGAYNIGMRHASRFAAVQAIAGAPSWLQYSGKEIPAAQQEAMVPMSGMQLAENAINTDFRYYHGRLDGGPMKPRFVDEFGALIRKLGVPFKETWFDDAGHDLLYLVHRHGKVYDELAPLRRKAHAAEVRVVTGDYRAARQHWVEVTRIEHFPELARVRALADGDHIRLETQNTLEVALDLREAPLTGTQLTINVDGKDVCSRARSAFGDSVHLYRDAAGWHDGVLPADPRPTKKPGSSGPITDAYFDGMVHVYGTADPSVTEALKKSATRGAQGWPVWLWRVEQPVIADTEVTDALMHSKHLVLYGTPGSNRVLEKIAAQLPVRIDAASVTLGARTFDGKGVGVKMIYPNPLAPERYVMVQAAPTVQGVDGGHNLPDFLPDYVVYDARTTASRPRLAFDRGHTPRAMGYFDRNWQLPEKLEAGDDAPVASVAHVQPQATPPAAVEPAATPATTTTTTAHGAEAPRPAKLNPAPPAPPPPAEFAAAASTQAGQAARQIAQRIAKFTNYRSKIHGASWNVDPGSVWSVRDNDQCLAELREKNIPFREVSPTLTTPVATPVEVTGPVDGVLFRMMHADRTLMMSCELAVRLPDIARVVKAHGVKEVAVISTYRDKPFSSFHTFGLGLDIDRLITDKGSVSVLADFKRTPDFETCSAPPPDSPRARLLLEVACELAATRHFSSVLTPNYNEGHRNHFHIDVRPDDPRTFVR
jgi:enterochelin esterase-like enzyme